jgi:transcriptional regulator of NAD metabolism
MRSSLLLAFCGRSAFNYFHSFKIGGEMRISLKVLEREFLEHKKLAIKSLQALSGKEFYKEMTEFISYLKWKEQCRVIAFGKKKKNSKTSSYYQVF